MIASSQERGLHRAEAAHWTTATGWQRQYRRAAAGRLWRSLIAYPLSSGVFDLPDVLCAPQRSPGQSPNGESLLLNADHQVL